MGRLMKKEGNGRPGLGRGGGGYHCPSKVPNVPGKGASRGKKGFALLGKGRGRVLRGRGLSGNKKGGASFSEGRWRQWGACQSRKGGGGKKAVI